METIIQTIHQEKEEILNLINANNILSNNQIIDVLFNWCTVSYRYKNDLIEDEEFWTFQRKFTESLIRMEDSKVKEISSYKRMVPQTIGSEKDPIWCDGCKKLTLDEAFKLHKEALYEKITWDSNIAEEILNQGCFTPIGKRKGNISPNPFHPKLGCEVCGNKIHIFNNLDLVVILN